MPPLLDPVLTQSPSTAQPDWYGQDQSDLTGAQPQPQPPAQQVPNPDAPKGPQVDANGDPTDFHSSALALVQNFDAFVHNGGDITKLGKSVFDNVQYAVENLPDSDNKPNSPSAMYTLYKQGKARNIVSDIFQTPGFTPKEIAEDPAAAAAATAVTFGGAIGEAAQKFDYGKAFQG